MTTTEREAVFRRWLLTAGMSDPDIRTPTLTLYAAWQAFAGERPGSVGWFAAAMRSAGVLAYRTNKQKGFKFKLITIDEIAQNISAATKRRGQARRAQDGPALEAAVRAQLQAKRQAGALLDAGAVLPSLYIGDGVAEFCQALARMTDDRFEQRVHGAVGQALRAMKRPPPGEPVLPVRTIISEWFIDSDGLMTRTISTPGEKPILINEGPFQECFQDGKHPAQRSNSGLGREV